jgi:hypothetical protein
MTGKRPRATCIEAGKAHGCKGGHKAEEVVLVVLSYCRAETMNDTLNKRSTMTLSFAFTWG